MKILWTHNWPDERKSMGPFMWTLLEGLRKKNIHIDLYYVGSGYNPNKALSNFKKLKLVAKEYDLVHAQYGSLTGYITSKLDMPSLLSIRGSDWHQYIGNDIKENLHSKIACYLTRRAIKDYNEIIVMSERMQKEINRISHSVINVIPDPIDLDLFNIEEKKESRKKLFNDESSSPWVLFNTLSKTNPVKRLGLAEQVIEEVRKSIPNVQMKIASNIAYKDMPTFINSCDLALCTSTHEGWPNSIKEALACGLPFVSTNVSDLDLLSEKSSYCYVSEDNIKEMANGIISILNNQESINKEDLRDLVNYMSVDNISDNLISVYNRMLNK
ncbi:glycosyl transferase [Photobacterium angustum S14]|uniref:Glycosyl transferase n=2 Tax=Photobacterium angustum TaxID=661 RepID=Q1ZRK5_PHOAS|nr:glycosyl transferase [Photobacterium angustum S14]